MSNKDENKSRKRLTLSIILIVSLGILSITYAVLTSQLNINSTDSQLTNKHQNAVQFVSDASFAYSAGSDTSEKDSKVNYGPFYSEKSGKTPSYDLASETSSSYLFAQAGKVTITDENKKDTATIDGTRLFDKGAYVVYKLQVKNVSELPVRLSSYSNAALINSISSEDEALKNVVKDIVEVKIYTSDPSGSDAGATELSAISAEDATNINATQANYLKSNETSDWYVKVSCKKDAESFATGTFSFSVQPTWMPVQKS